MGILAGAKVRASDVPSTYEGVASANLTLSTTVTDITGATVTFSTTRANQVVKITATFDMQITATGTGYLHGNVSIDGIVNARQALFLAQAAETRLTCGLGMLATIPAAGSHTIKLRGSKDSAGGTGVIVAGACTSVVVVVFP